MPDPSPPPSYAPQPDVSEATGSSPPASQPAESSVSDNSLQPAGEFLPLDPRVVRLWRLNQLFGWSIYLLLSFGIAAFSFLMTSGIPTWLIVAFLITVALVAGFVFWYPQKAYAAWGYRMNDRTLEIRSGLLVHSIRLVPLSRVQHADLHRGVFDRMFGLSSLVIFTAGTRFAATALPGLAAEDAVRLRDHLIAVGGDDAV